MAYRQEEEPVSIEPVVFQSSALKRPNPIPSEPVARVASNPTLIKFMVDVHGKKLVLMNKTDKGPQFLSLAFLFK